MRALGLDVGDRRIGLALSDPTGMLASPYSVVERGPSDIADILRVAEENEVSEIVVGLPLSMSGGSGSQAGKVRGFIRELRDQTDLPIKTVDERLSTVQAQDYAPSVRPPAPARQGPAGRGGGGGDIAGASGLRGPVRLAALYGVAGFWYIGGVKASDEVA